MVNNEHAYRLAEAAARATSKQAVANEIGYTRGAVSQYLSRSYGANPAKLEAAIVARYDLHECPHTGINIGGPECQRRASAPRPFGGRAKENHWLACQTCRHNQQRGEPPCSKQ